MRWKPDWPAPRPAEGDTRAVTGFLWLPKKADGEWRWLEVAWWVEIGVRQYGIGGIWWVEWRATAWA